MTRSNRSIALWLTLLLVFQAFFFQFGLEAASTVHAEHEPYQGGEPVQDERLDQVNNDPESADPELDSENDSEPDSEMPNPEEQVGDVQEEEELEPVDEQDEQAQDLSAEELETPPIAEATVSTPPLLITEIVPQSAGEGQPYEYVEIFNNTSEDIDLSNYQLQYFTSNMNSPANRWTITDKTIKAKSTLVLWLKKFNDPDVPLWDFNSNYGVYVTPEQVFEVELTTAAQGLHDSSLRKVGIAGPDGVPISTALINANGIRDGIENRSVTYQANGLEVEMTKIANNVVPTPGTLAYAQVPGPETPVQLAVTPDHQSVHLSWSSNDPTAIAFNIYYTGAVQPLTVMEHFTTIEGLANFQEYRFRVTALDAEGNESPATAEITAFPQEYVDLVPPAVPTGLEADPGNSRVELSWDANHEPDLAGYRIFINGTIFDTVAPDIHTRTVTPLENGREYTFEITAYDLVGNESGRSQPIVASPVEEPMAIPHILIIEAVPDTHNFASYDAFEYLELYNNSAEEIDLQGYRIRSGSWDVQIMDSFKIAPWDTALFWTRRAEIEPLTLEAFNSYYFTSYFSKYIPSERLKILGGIGGLVNSNSQTITVLDPFGLEVVKAHYTGDDVSELGAIMFGYPKDGTIVMETLAGHQKPQPGWVNADQVPLRPQQHTQEPQAPADVQAVAHPGRVELTWAANPEEDLYRYHIYKNDQLEFSVPATEQQFTVYSLIGNQEVTFELTAEDLSGNVSAKSDPVTVTPEHQRITQEERVIHSKDPSYSMLWEISTDGPVIPGLAQDLVPQGLTYDPENNWLLAVYYLDDKRPSTIAVIDATTEEFIKAVVLYKEDGTPYTGHAGGITVSREHVWVGSETFLYQMRLSDLVEAENNEEVRFIEQIPLPVDAAYNVYADGVMWVGEFYEAKSYPTDRTHHLINRDGEMYYAWMAGYVLDEETDTFTPEQWDKNSDETATPDHIFSTTEKVQGAVILEDQIILSTSYGRGNDSLLFNYKNPLDEPQHTSVTVHGKTVPVWFLDRQAEREENSRLVFVPMTEGITTIGNQLYVMTEAGATKYRYTTTYPLDRLLIVDLDLWRDYGLSTVPPVDQEDPPVDQDEPPVDQEEPPVDQEEPPVDPQQPADQDIADAGDRNQDNRSKPDQGQKHILELTKEELKQAKGNFKMQKQHSSLLLPAHLASWLTTEGIHVQGHDVELIIPAAVLEQAVSQFEDKEQEKAKLMISILPVEERAAQSLIKKAALRLPGSLLTLQGPMVELQIAAQSESGETYNVSTFGDEVTLRFPLIQGANERLAGLYHITKDGQLEFITGSIQQGFLEGKTNHFSYYAVFEKDSSFVDVPHGHWAEQVIKELAAKHVVTGASSTHFAPNARITRAQFAALLSRALDLKAGEEHPFHDVAADKWYTEAVAAVYQAGLLQGVTPNSFAPDEPITREQMAVLVVRALDQVEEVEGLQDVQFSTALPFQDAQQISAWALEEVARAVHDELFRGRNEGVFDPQGLATRGEAIQVIYSLMIRLQLH